MQIPFALPDIGEGEVAAVTECLRSGWLTTGRKVQEFEAAFAHKVGAKHAIACSSATMAALLILDSLGCGYEDEIIIPTYTFTGPAMMAHRLGMNVVLADSACSLHPEYNIEVDEVARRVTDRTRVVMPTHFAGSAVNMRELREFCDEKQLFLVDDAAHAFPTLDSSTGEMVGSGVADATFFSFYATKTLSTGEGGMIVTPHDWLAERIRKKVLHGFNRQIFDRYTNLKSGWEYDICTEGWKANMPDTAAAMGLVQLARADDLHDKRSHIARQYHAALKNVIGVCTPVFDPCSAWHLYPILVPERDRFIAAMAERGVQCSVHFKPIHLHSAWQAIVGEQDHLQHATGLFEHEVSLPIYSKLRTDEIHHIIRSVHEVAACLRA
jgi:dTDP-4-amino-4,6-dideoxygalactose transaminase